MQPWKRGGRVRVETLDDRYWQTRFNGARRVINARDVAPVLIIDVTPPIASNERSSPQSPSDEAALIIKP